MKRITFVLSLLLAHEVVFAQIDAPQDKAAIGIGATSTSTTYKFPYQNHNVAYYGLGWYADQQFAGGPMGYLSAFGGLKLFTGSAERVFISNNGNVGMGTSSPISKLHVIGMTRADGIILSEGATSLGFVGRGNSFTSGWNGYPNLMTITYHSRDFAIGGWKKSDGQWMGASLFINSDNGFIGIGTTAPTEKLSVKGKIRAQEIKVETANWPDYVFEPSYYSYSLPELEAFIKENKHLPEIPSAKEVEKEGINVGEMNAKLLQKIEELTLHLIEQNKRLEMHSRKFEEQERLIKDQQKEIQNLKGK